MYVMKNKSRKYLIEDENEMWGEVCGKCYNTFTYL